MPDEKPKSKLIVPREPPKRIYTGTPVDPDHPDHGLLEDLGPKDPPDDEDPRRHLFATGHA